MESLMVKKCQTLFEGAKCQTLLKAQASLELTVAVVGALLLLYGSLKLVMWLNERVFTRHVQYNDTRATAAQDDPGAAYEPTQKFNVLQ